MAETPVSTKTSQRRSESGLILQVLALAPSHRIVGTVELRFPLEPGITLESRIGADREREIVQAAKELAHMVAAAVENPTAGNVNS